MEAPANIVTPTRFCELATEKFAGLDNVTITAQLVFICLLYLKYDKYIFQIKIQIQIYM